MRLDVAVINFKMESTLMPSSVFELTRACSRFKKGGSSLAATSMYFSAIFCDLSGENTAVRYQKHLFSPFG